MIQLTPILEGEVGAQRMYLPARCGGQTFAISAASALAVLRLDNLTLAYGAPAHVVGVANTKFGVVAVICLARWLNLCAPASALGGPAVLMGNGAEIIALAVDEFADAFAASHEHAVSAPLQQGPAPPPRLSGALRLGSQLISILDLSSLFDSHAPAENVSLAAY